jgi:hypothetical protein
MQLLVEEKNIYYLQYLDMLDEECCPLPDVTIHEIYWFLGIVLQTKETDSKNVGPH